MGSSPTLANHQAGLVIRNALFRLPAAMNADAVPRVTFTDPELAQVGLTEAQARARGVRHPGAALALSRERPRPGRRRRRVGHIKVVTDRRGKVLGATIVGAGAGELITTWTLAIAKRSNIRTFVGIMVPYPTLAEIGKRAAMTYFITRFDQLMGAAHHRLAAPLRLSRGARINGHMTEGPAAADEPSRTRPHLGLSGKLLVLTLLFVMIAEVLIYVPSIANFRLNWLNDRLSAAYTAALVFETAPNGMVTDTVARQILDSIGARAVAMKMGQQRRLLAASEMPPAIEPRHRHAQHVVASRHHRCVRDADLRRQRRHAGGGTGAHGRRVRRDRARRGAAAQGDGGILDHASCCCRCSFPAITAALVYLALHCAAGAAAAAHDRQHDGVPRPTRRIPRASSRPRTATTRSAPPSASWPPCSSTRHDAAAEEPSRRARAGGVEDQPRPAQPAVLGAAVLRAAGEDLPDPHVQRFAPKLMRSLERAIAFCQSTLSYGRVQEPPPDRRPIALEPLVEDVRETLGLDPGGAPVRWISAVERGLMVDADPDQLFRIMLNLVRNALQALESRDARDPGRDQIRITGRREGAVAVIEVSDTGPGHLRARARASVRGLPGLDPHRQRGAGPRHRGRAGARPWRRHPPGGRHHRRDLPRLHPRPRRRHQRAPRRAPARDRDGPGVARQNLPMGREAYRERPVPAGLGWSGSISRAMRNKRP